MSKPSVTIPIDLQSVEKLDVNDRRKVVIETFSPNRTSKSVIYIVRDDADYNEINGPKITILAVESARRIIVEVQ